MFRPCSGCVRVGVWAGAAAACGCTCDNDFDAGRASATRPVCTAAVLCVAATSFAAVELRVLCGPEFCGPATQFRPCACAVSSSASTATSCVPAPASCACTCFPARFLYGIGLCSADCCVRRIFWLEVRAVSGIPKFGDPGHGTRKGVGVRGPFWGLKWPGARCVLISTRILEVVFYWRCAVSSRVQVSQIECDKEIVEEK